MKELTHNEMLEINGGDKAAYDAGHAVGDFIQEVVRGVLMIIGVRALLLL